MNPALLLAAAFAAAPIADDAPPAALLEQLVAPEYPERVAATRHLTSWAAERGEAGLAWLAEQTLRGENPEIRRLSREVLGRVLAGQGVDSERRSYLGVVVEPKSHVTANGKHTIKMLAVKKVLEGSPADQAGIKPGHVILGIQGVFWGELDPARTLAREVGRRAPGETIRIKTYDKAPEAPPRHLEIELAAPPEEPVAGGLDGAPETGAIDDPEKIQERLDNWLDAYKREHGL